MLVSRRGLAEAVLVVSILLGAWKVADARRPRQPEPGFVAGDFNFYVLSLTVAPSFCTLERSEHPKAQCADPSDAAYRETPLTVHGLWPNRIGVGTRNQPQDCDAERLTSLAPELQAELVRYMPGAADGLDRYEWRKHGSCSGLDPDAYFRAIVVAARTANATISEVMREQRLFGQTVRIEDLLSGVAARDPVLARSIVVDCRFARKKPGQAASVAYIREIRVTLNRYFPNTARENGTLSRDAFLPLSEVGMRPNSGCPGGAGFLPGGYGEGAGQSPGAL